MRKLSVPPLIMDRLARWMPGLPELLSYNRKPLKRDLIAGLSVAAVCLPVSIAYAQLAGFSPVVGLYSTILPMIVYAFFGSSRQLIVGPDAATCAMIMATLTPLMVAGDNPEYYHALAVSLTLFTGVFCILAGRFRLGFLADLLSRSILVGLLNGVAIIIIVGQLGKVFGIGVEGKNVVRQLISFFEQAQGPHWPTLLLSFGLALLYLVLMRFWRKGPSALIVAVVAVAVSFALDLAGMGVAVIGDIPSALPSLRWPALPPESWGTLLPAAAALAFISFSSATLTARSFAAKNGYDIDSNKELYALGASNIASALSQGFAISGADSRTAVNDAAGGKTRMVQIFAALAILLVLLVLTSPLAHLPKAALGIILIFSAIKLTDFRIYTKLREASVSEFRIALATLLAVVLIGVMQGILLAVLLALLRFLMRTARPVDFRLGLIESQGDFYELEHYPDAKEIPGLLFYRFEASLIFFNANYFKQRVTDLIETSETPVRWVVIDGRSINNIDLTGALMLYDLSKTLAARGVVLALTGRSEKIMKWMRMQRGDNTSLPVRLFQNRRLALEAYRDMIAAEEKKLPL
ncbi:MAG: SulP family inorganic anion transporter [Proteobacteria bacterium]|nr:SulP family inorganic anion transporter [Pseudomonadota bacterium]MCL2306910.1 SulP family inorganic anion transporter [Pseudomonadota bacterium]